MDELPVLLPDGTLFPLWDDETSYSKVYHVDCHHPEASDSGPGSDAQPFASVNAAARVVGPGEKVVVHEGVYRECVRPVRGGTGPNAMVAYEAAPGENVIVRGSVLWQPTFERSVGWSMGNAWTAPLPAGRFVGYNPFLARNFSSEYTTFVTDWHRAENERFLLRRGMLFVDGRPLAQVYHPHELASMEGVFWVEDSGLRVHLRLWEDADPFKTTFEITVHEQVFAPEVQGLGYVRVSGFHLEHAADGFPVPQRALLSTSRGHHWIIEDNEVAWANAGGIDVGNETWHRAPKSAEEPAGHHILRRNVVRDCGICGIAAMGNNVHTLVEDNLVERVGAHRIERLWETGGLKFHTCDGVLIRRNVFRHLWDSPGIWLDYLNRNSRVTGNVFADIESLHGAVYVEVSHAPNLIDHNVIWDVRDRPASSRAAGVAPRAAQGHGIDIDTGEGAIVANNLIANVRDGFAVSVNLDQAGRVVHGRVGLCRDHRVINNVIAGSPRRVLLARVDDNQVDGNVYNRSDDATSFRVETPAPPALLDWDAWQRYYGFDTHGDQRDIEVDFDPETLLLTLSLGADAPRAVPVETLPDQDPGAGPGPVTIEPGRRAYRIEAGPGR